ncbi:MAG: hypothetical protein H7A24_06770 [Leptospiraceae bacterium]|nr:hypothetical protein [Leptospiraceae bacterium]MCP5511565.1 hypothetical protein [Leptospiraceae bacterium]
MISFSDLIQFYPIGILISIFLYLVFRQTVKNDHLKLFVELSKNKSQKNGFPVLRNIFFLQSFAGAYSIILYLISYVHEYHHFLILNTSLLVFSFGLSIYFIKYGLRIGLTCMFLSIFLTLIYLSSFHIALKFISTPILSLNDPRNLPESPGLGRYSFSDLQPYTERINTHVLDIVEDQQVRYEHFMVAPLVHELWTNEESIRAFAICHHNGLNEKECRETWKKGYRDALSLNLTKDNIYYLSAIHVLKTTFQMKISEKPFLLELIPSHSEYEKNYLQKLEFLLIFLHTLLFILPVTSLIYSKKN